MKTGKLSAACVYKMTLQIFVFLFISPEGSTLILTLNAGIVFFFFKIQNRLKTKRPQWNNNKLNNNNNNNKLILDTLLFNFLFLSLRLYYSIFNYYQTFCEIYFYSLFAFSCYQCVCIICWPASLFFSSVPSSPCRLLLLSVSTQPRSSQSLLRSPPTWRWYMYHIILQCGSTTLQSQIGKGYQSI